MKFLICYIDDEGNEQQVEKEFVDTTDTIMGRKTIITARDWANDFAHAVADKGAFEIEEI